MAEQYQTIVADLNYSSEFEIETLYCAYHQELTTYFLKITQGNNVLADDLLQTLFLKVLTRKSSYNGQGSLKGWLFICARNLTRDHYRKKTIIDCFDESKINLDIIDNNNNNESKDILIDKLYDALTALKKRDREIIHLFYFQGLESKKIASILGIGAGAARTRIHRAIQRLRYAMGPQNYLIHSN